MATYAAATAERNRLMAFAPGVSASIRATTSPPGSDYELWVRDARQEAEKASGFDEKWSETTRAATLTAFS